MSIQLIDFAELFEILRPFGFLRSSEVSRELPAIPSRRGPGGEAPSEDPTPLSSTRTCAPAPCTRAWSTRGWRWDALTVTHTSGWGTIHPEGALVWILPG